MSITIVKCFIYGIIIFLCSSCAVVGLTTAVVPGLLVSILSRTTSPELEEIWQLPNKKQRYEKFKKYPLETQIEIHIAAMEQIHPPHSSFGDIIAEQNQDIIPILIEKIKIEKNETLLPSTSVTRKNEIKLRKEFIFEIIRTAISRFKISTNEYRCDLKLTLEQLNFLIEENPLAYECSSVLDSYWISLLLQCPQPNP